MLNVLKCSMFRVLFAFYLVMVFAYAGMAQYVGYSSDGKFKDDFVEISRTYTDTNIQIEGFYASNPEDKFVRYYELKREAYSPIDSKLNASIAWQRIEKSGTHTFVLPPNDGKHEGEQDGQVLTISGSCGSASLSWANTPDTESSTTLLVETEHEESEEPEPVKEYFSTTETILPIWSTVHIPDRGIKMVTREEADKLQARVEILEKALADIIKKLEPNKPKARARPVVLTYRDIDLVDRGDRGK